ncbi:hypothetical protein [Treponema zioleckii]|uniref:hypothetical protein n=1 Tax=Treponema zioleckii TaxID=331680 RepID=UPI00168B1E25|nr:hypothetical protein [Treponema zioleckii]
MRHRFLRWQVDNLSVLTQMHTDEHRWDTDFFRRILRFKTRPKIISDGSEEE